MSFAAISLIAVGPAMGAFAVSVAEGIVLRRITPSHALRVAVYFGEVVGGLIPVDIGVKTVIEHRGEGI